MRKSAEKVGIPERITQGVIDEALIERKGRNMGGEQVKNWEITAIGREKTSPWIKLPPPGRGGGGSLYETELRRRWGGLSRGHCKLSAEKLN